MSDEGAEATVLDASGTVSSVSVAPTRREMRAPIPAAKASAPSAQPIIDVGIGRIIYRSCHAPPASVMAKARREIDRAETRIAAE